MINKLDDERVEALYHALSTILPDRAYVLVYCEPGAGGQRDTGLMTNIADPAGGSDLNAVRTVLRWADENIGHHPQLVQQTFYGDQDDGSSMGD